MELQHEFAWSASRASGFRECKRSHYYQYYGGWRGWQRGEPALRQRIYQLGKLTRMPMVAGDAVHQSLAWYFRTKSTRSVDRKQVLEKARGLLRSKFKESRDGAWRNSASRYARLAEHLYEEDVVADRDATAAYGSGFIERINQCVEGFFAMPELAWLLRADPADYAFVEDPESAFESFEFEGTKVFGSPDFAIRDPAGHVHLYDWKTGRPSPNDAFQLHVYALYARARWGTPLEAFSGYDAYLLDGNVVKCDITRESLAAAENEMRASIEAMRKLYFDADRGMGDMDAFPMIPAEAPQRRVCVRCRFRELCGR